MMIVILLSFSNLGDSLYQPIEKSVENISI
jgi:hypothetical protein